ncbi:enoyl-CoA hydratase/isomerase family protein [Calidifontibacter terrae]
MSTEDTVVVERDGGVRTVRINRPDAMCALNLATKVALLRALREAADDESVRCVVLTGTGKGFCVGQDLKEHVVGLESGEDLSGTVTDHYNPIVELLATMNKPVIAAVNGVAAGAGASFAFACDFRLVHEAAGFNTSFTGIALSCDSGASWTLPRLVGPAKAKELLLLPRTVKAPEASELGLATTVFADADFAAGVKEFASRLATGPTIAFGSVRRAVAFSATNSLADSLANEGRLMTVTGSTDDHRSAVGAFLAKESPVFEGR